MLKLNHKKFFSFFIVLFILVTSSFLFNTNSVKTQSSPITNIERGFDYKIIQYANGTYVWMPMPFAVYNFANNSWCDYIFTETKDYIEARNAYITVRIYDGYAQFLDPNATEVRVYMEQWMVQQYQNNKWKDVIGTYSTLISKTVITNSSGIFITKTWSSWAGNLTVIYILKIGRPLKHTVIFTSTSISGKVRFIQSWSGVQANKMKYKKAIDQTWNETTNLSSATLSQSLYFQFEDNSGKLLVYEDQYNAKNSFQSITLTSQANGLKIDYTFQNATLFTVNPNQKVTLDPDTATYLPNSTNGKAHYIEQSGRSSPYPSTTTGTEVGSADYSKLQNDDDDKFLRQPSIASGPGYVLGQLNVHFTISQSINSITQLQYVWESSVSMLSGSGASTSSSGVCIYTDSGDISQSHGTGITYTVTSNFANYLDNSNTAHIGFYVVGYVSRDGGYGTWNLYVDYVKLIVTVNSPPTNNGLSLVNPSIGSQGCLAQKQAYTFRVLVSDPDGGTNLNYVEITLDPGGQNLKYRWTESTDTFSEVNDPNNYASINSTSADSTLSGTQWTLDFKITFAWTYPDENLHSVQVYSLDDASASDTDTYTNIYYVENDLVFSGLTVSDTRVNPSQTLTFSGTIYYQGTTITPPDGNYNVKVKLNGVQKGSTDTTLVSGQFSINDVTAESTVGSYTYTVECDHMAGAGSFPNVIVDRLNVYYQVLNDYRVNVNSPIEYRVKIVLDYDETPISSSSTVTSNTGTMTWDNTNGYWKVSKTLTSVDSFTFQISSINEATYGITTLNINSTNPTGIWDRLTINYKSPSQRTTISDSAILKFKLRSEYDNTFITSGSVMVNGTSATWDGNYWSLSVSQNQATKKFYAISSVNWDAYGITALNPDSLSNSTYIIWDRIQFNQTTININASSGTAYTKFNISAYYAYNGSYVNNTVFYVWDGSNCVGQAYPSANGLIQFTLNSTLHGQGQLIVNGSDIDVKSIQLTLPYDISISNLQSSIPDYWTTGEIKQFTINFINSANLNGTKLALENVAVKAYIKKGDSILTQWSYGNYTITDLFNQAFDFIPTGITENGQYTFEVDVIQYGSEYLLGSTSKTISVVVGQAPPGAGGGGELSPFQLSLFPPSSFTVKPGETKTLEIPFKISGATAVTINNVEVISPSNVASWIKWVQNEPLSLWGEGNKIVLEVSPPLDANYGSYEVALKVSALSGSNQYSTYTKFTLNVGEAPSGGSSSQFSSYILYILTGLFISIFVISLFYRKK